MACLAVMIALVIVIGSYWREPVAEQYRRANAFAALAALYGVVIAVLITVVVVNKLDGGIGTVVSLVILVLALGWLTFFFGWRNTFARLRGAELGSVELVRLKAEIKLRSEVLGFVTAFGSSIAIALNALALAPESSAKFWSIGVACCMGPVSCGALARKLALAIFEQDKAVDACRQADSLQIGERGT